MALTIRRYTGLVHRSVCICLLLIVAAFSSAGAPAGPADESFGRLLDADGVVIGTFGSVGSDAGWFMGADGVVRFTLDGGDRWTELQDGLPPALLDNFFRWQEPSAVDSALLFNLNGDWSGTTSQGHPLSFPVVNNAVPSITVKCYIGACGAAVETTTTFGTPMEITSNNFTLNVSASPLSYTAEGTFTSDTTANGTVNFDFTNPYPYCHGTAAATWNATKEAPPVYNYYFPRLSYHSGTWTEGYGFVNPSNTDASVDFEAFANNGSSIAQSAVMPWAAHCQGAYQAEGILGLTQPTEAWVSAQSDSNSLRGFFLTQYFSGGLAGLDGAAVFTTTLTEGIFPRVMAADTFTTEMFVANPGASAVEATFTGFDGVNVHAGGTQAIPARGFLKLDTATLFGTAFNGYVHVTATGGVIGNAVTQDGTLSISSINLQPVSESSGTPDGLDGNWAGTTSQGRPISFPVADSAIPSLTVQGHISACGATVDMTTTFGTPLSTAGNQFSANVTSSPMSYTINGTFTSDAAANGTINFDYTNPYPYCHGTAAATWTASKAGKSTAPPQPTACTVLLLSPDTTEGDITSLQNALAGYADLTVSVWDNDLGDPWAEALAPFDVVIIGNDILWDTASMDPVAVGDALADYIDGGGKVIESLYTQSYDEWGFGGRYMTGGYSPFTPATQDLWDPDDVAVVQGGHAVMQGVTAIHDNWGHQDPGLQAGATLLAQWGSSNYNAVAVNDNVVAINMLIFHDADWTGDVPTLLHNAIVWLCGGGTVQGKLYAPHIVLMPDIYYTEVNLINPSPTAVDATLSPFYANGTPMADPFQVQVPAQQLVTLRDTELGLPQGLQTEGWLLVDSGTQPLVGCLTFGNPQDNHIMSTLPLLSAPATEMFFAQCANSNVGGVDFFTGIAVINPNEAATDVTFYIHGSDGTLHGTAVRSLAAREKYVRLIHFIEGIGTLPTMSSGYIRITATQPVFSFVLFGDTPLNFLSGVPAQY